MSDDGLFLSVEYRVYNKVFFVKTGQVKNFHRITAIFAYIIFLFIVYIMTSPLTLTSDISAHQ